MGEDFDVFGAFGYLHHTQGCYDILIDGVEQRLCKRDSGGTVDEDSCLLKHLLHLTRG